MPIHEIGTGGVPAWPIGAAVTSGRTVRAAAGVVLALGIAVFAIAAVLRAGRPGQIAAVDVVDYAVVYLAAAVLLAVPAADRGALRRGWRWFAAALVVNAAGNVMFSLVAQESATSGAPSVADVLYLAWYPLAWIGLVELVRGSVPRVPAGQALDGLVAGLGAASLGIAGVVGGLLDETGGAFLERLVALAYPIGDLVLLFLLVAGSVTLGRGLRPSGALLTTGLVVTTVADVVYLVQDAENSYVEGGWWDLVWLLGVAAIGAAGVVGGPVAQPAPPSEDGVSSSWAGTFAAPGMSAAVCVGVIGLHQAGLVGWVAVVPADAGVLLALVRAVLTLRDLHRTQVGEVARLHEVVRTDDLTGLPNRRAVSEECRRMLLPDADTGLPVCMIVVDVDRFKDVNDSLSPQVGDDLLRAIGVRLAGAVPPEALLGRLGGDEFAVLLRADDRGGRGIGEAVRTAVVRPFAVGGMQLHVDLTVGVATARPASDAAPTDLLRRAGLALYRAKRTRSGIAVHDGDDETSRDRLRLTEELRAALAGDEPTRNGTVFVHVQPQLALTGKDAGRVVGAEALVRWEHPVRGRLMPSLFLPVAEAAGLLPRLADVVLDSALGACRAWWDAGHRVPVSVNVAATDVLDRTLLGRVSAALARHGLPPEALVVELTEDSLLADPDGARAVLEDLRSRGVQLSVDDYGSGYSSLAYLRELPVDELKLDRAFVTDLAHGTGDGATRAAAIVRTTADLAHSLGLRLVAEGIEDEATLQQLAGLGVDVGQGFWIAEPMPSGLLGAWLDRRPAVEGRTPATSEG